MSQENNDLRTQEILAQEGLESIGQKLSNTINIELSGNPQSARQWHFFLGMILGLSVSATYSTISID